MEDTNATNPKWDGGRKPSNSYTQISRGTDSRGEIPAVDDRNKVLLELLEAEKACRVAENVEYQRQRIERICVAENLTWGYVDPHFPTNDYGTGKRFHK